ncbi:hypothetical protein ACP70R_026950 [Stipagrostis hirtigluma subsp. patula]
MDHLAVAGRGSPTPNGGVVGAEERMARRRKVELVQEAIHGFLEEKRRGRQGEELGPMGSRQDEEGLLSSLLTKLDALEEDDDLSNVQPDSLRSNSQPGKGDKGKEVELADIAKDLKRIKRQNLITHVLLGTVIVLTAVWQVNEVSFLLWVQEKLSNPFKSLGDVIKSSLKMRRRKPVIETSPLPPVGIPDVTRADLPTLIIRGEHR